MSQTATSVDFKKHLVNMIRYAGSTYTKDLLAIPADKHCECPMGLARNPLNFTVECAWFNNMVVDMLNGVTPVMPSEEEKAEAKTNFDTLEKVLPHFEKSVDALASAVEKAEESKLAEEVMAFWGQPVSLYALAHIASSHLSYHDGQLNYIQSLYGDDKNHWND